MTKQNVKFGRNLVKRASAVALALCVGTAFAPVSYAAGQVNEPVEAVEQAQANNASDNPVKISIRLNQTSLNFDKIGDTKKLTATVNPASEKVSWVCSNTKVATVDQKGQVKAVGNGTATVTAKAGNEQASASITVKQKSEKVSILLSGKKVSGTLKATVGKSYQFTAKVTPQNTARENKTITWSSSDKKIATVAPKTGKVTIKKTGTVKITAKTADGKTASVQLKTSKKAVKATSVKIEGKKSMKAKKKQQLEVIFSPATVSNKKVAWKSSSPKIATVNSKGVVTAKKKGTVKITVTTKDGSKKKASIQIRIK